MARGNQVRMSRNLGLHRNTVQRLLVRHGVSDQEIEEIKKVLPPLVVSRGRPRMKTTGIPRHRQKSYLAAKKKLPSGERLTELEQNLLSEFPLTGKEEV